MADSITTALTAAAALGGIVGLILLIGRLLRHTSLTRFGGSGAAGRTLMVKETISLDARRRLHLVQHGDRCVLLLTGGTSDIVVGWVDGAKSP